MEIQRQTLRRLLNGPTVDIPKRTVHVNHRHDVIVGHRVPQGEPIQQCVQRQQKQNRTQQATTRNDDDQNLESRKLQRSSSHSVIANLFIACAPVHNYLCIIKCKRNIIPEMRPTSFCRPPHGAQLPNRRTESKNAAPKTL